MVVLLLPWIFSSLSFPAIAGLRVSRTDHKISDRTFSAMHPFRKRKEEQRLDAIAPMISHETIAPPLIPDKRECTACSTVPQLDSLRSRRFRRTCLSLSFTALAGSGQVLIAFAPLLPIFLHNNGREGRLSTGSFHIIDNL